MGRMGGPAWGGDLVLSLAVMLAAALYRPLRFWAQNAWDVQIPTKVMLVAFAGFVTGVLVWLVLRRAGIRAIPGALVVATGLLVFYHWTLLPVTPWMWLLLGGGIPVWLQQSEHERQLRWIALAGLLVLGVFPIANLLASHWLTRGAFPTRPIHSQVRAVPSGHAEDLVLVVPDTYPSPSIANAWFGHDTSSLQRALEAKGVVFEQAALSRHTFTGVSVPSILDLETVIDAGPTGQWGHRQSLYRRVGGESFTHAALRSAGFNLIHIESGWNGTRCGKGIDECYESPFIDEAVSAFLEPSLAGVAIERAMGSYALPATESAVENTVSVLEEIQGNGRHDFVFVHLILPHPPVLVDEKCILLDEALRPAQDAEFTEFKRQLACVDRWLSSIAEAAAPETVMVIAADHGSSYTGQAYDPPELWTDASVAERFSILLAYRLAPACIPPIQATNLDAFRAAVACVVDVDQPPATTGHLIGFVDAAWVEPRRMQRIHAGLQAGSPPEPPPMN